MFESVVGGPGAGLAGALAAVVPAGLEDADLIEAMREWERLAAWVAAGQLAVIAELARRRPRDCVSGRAGRTDRGDPAAPEISEFAVDEVAAALRLSRPAAGIRLQLAVELAGRLSGTAVALRDGVIDVPKARAVVDAVVALDDATAVAVEQRVLPRAGGQTVGQLRASLSRAVLAVDPATAEIRHQRAVAERMVTLRALPDGMAGLWALLPADGATALYTRLDQLARRTGHRPGDHRSMDNRRADALLALALTDITPAGATGPPRSALAGLARGPRSTSTGPAAAPGSAVAHPGRPAWVGDPAAAGSRARHRLRRHRSRPVRPAR